MTALAVILSFLFLIILLLLTKVKLHIASDGDIRLRAGIGPFSVGVMPKKKKRLRLRDFSQKKYLSLMEETPKEANTTEKTIKKHGGFSETRDYILDLIEKSLKYTRKLYCKIHRLHVRVGGKDAASAAVTYGAVSGGVSCLLELLDCKTKLTLPRGEKLWVVCDYTSESVSVETEITLGIRILDAVSLAFELFMTKLRREEKINGKNTPSNIRKDGNKNGRK